MMRKIIFAICMSLFVSVSMAEVLPIKGGFGFKLGDTFDTSTAIGTKSRKDGGVLYVVNAVKPFKDFSMYMLQITPKTKIIHTIYGVNFLNDYQLCKNKQAVLFKLLQDKYGTDSRDVISMDSVKNIVQGEKTVDVRCIDNFDNSTYIITYHSVKLAQLAEAERIAIEGKKINTDGL